MGVSNLAMPISVPAISGLMDASTWVLGALAILMAAGIWGMNFYLRRQSIPPEMPIPIPTTSEPTL
jgi:hypothetical protein